MGPLAEWQVSGETMEEADPKRGNSFPQIYG